MVMTPEQKELRAIARFYKDSKMDLLPMMDIMEYLQMVKR